MGYTLLRVAPGGIVLGAAHARRLGCTPGELAALALPAGIFAVWSGPSGLRFEARPGSRLVEGMPVRFAPSPLRGDRPVPKPEPPGPFGPLRSPGVVTLLTSQDGTELLEADCAAVIGLREGMLLCVPGNRARVTSLAEAALREHLEFREAPLLTKGQEPLLLINAVKGTCAIDVPGRQPFPAAVRARIEAVVT